MAKNWTDKAAKTKIGGIFFTSDDGLVQDDQEVRAQAAVAQVAQARPMPTAFGSSVPLSTVPSSFATFVPSNVDPDIRAKIQAVADGVDQRSYTKFVDVVGKMKSKFPDEASCYHTAVVACEAVGLPLSEILRGLDAILNEFTQADRKFKEAAPQRLATKVGARREKIAQIKQTVSVKQEEMRRLQESLGRLNAEITQLSQAEQAEQSAISQDEQTVREDAAKFSAALEVVRAPYVAERQKIELYGRGA